MFRTVKVKIPVCSCSSIRKDGLCQRRWFARGRGSSDVEDEHGISSVKSTEGSPGSGEGKGGGGGGTIRSAGGGMGKMAAYQEESYFHKKTVEELEKLHNDMKNELDSARKSAEDEKEKDKKVENKMKELAHNLKDIIDEGKKND